jgi:hypothetical protein
VFLHQLPQFRTRLAGDALVLTFEVDDAEEALREVQAPAWCPRSRCVMSPGGQWHFMVRDPAGVGVDVVQPIDPDPAFLDQPAREQLAALNEA